MTAARTRLLFLVLMSVDTLLGGAITFEDLADQSRLTGYAGLIFSNATVLKSELSLDEVKYPPRSGANVVTDAGGPMTILFSQPVWSVGAYFTYRTDLILTAYDELGHAIVSIRSKFHDNLAGGGDAGSFPDELLEVILGSALIKKIVISGDANGYSFALDDLFFYGMAQPAGGGGSLPEVPAGPVPEPGTVIMTMSAMLACCFRRWRKFACFCALAVCWPAVAAGIPGQPKAVPDVLFPAEPAMVTITASVTGNAIPESVNLIRARGDGSLQVLGRLYDDGSQGDRTARDGIYTGRFVFSEPAGGKVTLFVSAAYGNEVLRQWSLPLTLAVFTRPDIDELREELAVLEQAGTLFERLRQSVGDNPARVLVLDYLRGQSVVVEAGPAPGGGSIWVRFRSQIHGNVIGNPRGTRGAPGESGSERLAAAPPFSSAAATVPVGSGGTLVLSPFSDQFAPYDESDAVAESLSCADPVVPLRNDAVTVEVMKTLPQYGTVSIVTHGIVDGSGKVVIATGERSTAEKLLANLADALAGRLNIGAVGGQSYFLITPAFVSYYAGEGYRNTLVYVSACLTFGADGDNYTLADAFLNAGASAYFGWQQSVNTDFADRIGTAFFSLLTDRLAAEGERRTGAAFAGLGDRRDPATPNAVFLMKGNDALVLNACAPQ